MKTLNSTILLALALLILGCAPIVPGSIPDTAEPAAATASEAPPPIQATESQGYPAQEPAADSGYPAETAAVEGYPAPAGDSGYPVPAGCTIPSAVPVRIEFGTADGLTLVGTFYPSANCDVPIVVLMHQFGSNKESWAGLADWLQNRSSDRTAAASPANPLTWFPEMPAGRSFAVLSFDFRRHGESPSDGDDDTDGFLIDAQAALAFARTLPNVVPDRIITIGASIGADASVNACLVIDGDDVADFQESQGCIAALALSPGSFLGVPYGEASARLLQPPFQVQLVCAAAELDGVSAIECSATSGPNYASTIYSARNEHGIALLQPGLDPEIGILILNFLNRTLLPFGQ